MSKFSCYISVNVVSLTMFYLVFLSKEGWSVSDWLSGHPHHAQFSHVQTLLLQVCICIKLFAYFQSFFSIFLIFFFFGGFWLWVKLCILSSFTYRFVDTDGKGFDRVRRTEIGKKYFKLTHFEEVRWSELLVSDMWKLWNILLYLSQYISVI